MIWYDFMCLCGRFLLIINEIRRDFEVLQQIPSDFVRSQLISDQGVQLIAEVNSPLARHV